MSLRRAIFKRPIDAEQINALLSDTLRRIENEFDNELPSRAIADAVMHGLRKSILSLGCVTPVSMRISRSSLGSPRKFCIWVGKGKVKTAAGKKDDYTRLQNLNSLFMVMGCFFTGRNHAVTTYTLIYERKRRS